MIITLEGPPASGKSTSAQRLASEKSAFVVPEVNLLFSRPTVASTDWYLGRQVARWEIGMRQRQDHDLVIFDGDLFQPLWFSWIYHDEDWGNLKEMEDFYRRELSRGRITFPDIFVVFVVDEMERWNREMKRGIEAGRDQQRIKRKYERYQRLIAPQHRYFKALQSRFPQKVVLMDSISIEENVEFISSLAKSKADYADMEIFDFIVDWLKNSRAGEFPPTQ